MLYNNEWEAIQYHWTLDSSCLYLARSSDSPKHNTCILDGYPSNEIDYTYIRNINYNTVFWKVYTYVTLNSSTVHFYRELQNN